MDRVLAAKSFSVELTIPGAPAYCRRFYTRRLSIKRTAPHQTVWLQAGSTFGL